MRTRGQIAVKDSRCIPPSRLPLPTGGRRTRPEAKVLPASMEQVAGLLHEVPLFAGVRAEDLRPLAAACRPCHYSRLEIIFHRDDPGDTLHIIQEGRVRIVLLSPEGAEIILAHFQHGDVFGELSLLDGCPRSATAIATEATTTLSLTRSAFMSVMEDSPPLAQQVILVLTARLRHTDVLLGDATFLDVAGRLAKRLLELSLVPGERSAPPAPRVVRATQADLAAMVGAARESVNRELRALEAQGLVRVRRGRILLPHPDALRALLNW